MTVCLSRGEIEQLRAWLESGCTFAPKQLLVLKKLVDRLLNSNTPEEGVNLIEFVTKDLGSDGVDWLHTVGKKIVLKSSFYKIRGAINQSLFRANPTGDETQTVELAPDSWHLQWREKKKPIASESSSQSICKLSLSDFLASAHAIYVVAPSQTGPNGELVPKGVLEFMQFLQAVSTSSKIEIRHYCMPANHRHDMTQRGLYFCLGNAEINPFTRVVVENYGGSTSAKTIQWVEDGDFRYALFNTNSFDNCIHLLRRWHSRAIEPIQSRTVQVA